MSIVSVHGPNTFGSNAVSNTSKSVMAMAITGDGTKWRFIPADQSKPAAQYDWTWSHTSGTAGGSPASPLNDTMIAEFTFPVGSVKSVILTLNTVAQAPITVTVPVAGAGPSMMLAPPEEGDGGEETSPEVPVGYDPAAHTVDEVEEYVTEHPEQAQEIYDAEEAGKNRVTLITWLEEFETE